MGWESGFCRMFIDMYMLDLFLDLLLLLLLLVGLGGCC